MAWTRITPAIVREYFARQRASDAVGLRVHLWCALAFLFFAGWPTTYVAWCGLPVLVCLIIRMTGHLYMLEALCWDRASRLTMAIAAWIGVSALWSPGSTKDWLNDANGLVFALAVPMLFPVLDRRRLLLWALVLGMACGQGSQLVHLVGVKLHVDALKWHRFDDRISGWWDPVVGGSLLCGVLGVWIGALAGGWVRRWIAAVAVVVTLLCILLTGTRGAWIGAGLTVVTAAALLGVRALRWPAWKAVAAAGVIAAAGAAAVVAAPALHHRAEQGWREVRGAIRERRFNSDTGMRLAMWVWAGRATAASPVWGVGAGGYEPWCLAQIAADKAAGRPTLPPPHRHAHSWPFHAAATLGLAGLGLMGWLVWVVVRSGFKSVDAVSIPVAMGVLGLVFAGMFDPIYINQQTAALFWILVALGLPMRPALRGTREPASDGGAG